LLKIAVALNAIMIFAQIIYWIGVLYYLNKARRILASRNKERRNQHGHLASTPLPTLRQGELDQRRRR
jgi:hypothetical protein